MAESREEAAEMLSRTAMLQQVKDMGVAYVVIDYSGSGDSGQIDDVKGYKSAEDRDMQYADGKSLAVDFKGDFGKAFEYLADTLIDQQHPGFENNDGGRGEITINVATGHVSWDHYDYYTNENHTGHHLDFLTGDEREPEEEEAA